MLLVPIELQRDSRLYKLHIQHEFSTAVTVSHTTTSSDTDLPTSTFEQFRSNDSTPAAVFKWIPSLALWGGAGAGAVMLFMSSVPLFKKDVLIKLPVVSIFSSLAPPL